MLRVSPAGPARPPAVPQNVSRRGLQTRASCCVSAGGWHAPLCLTPSARPPSADAHCHGRAVAGCARWCRPARTQPPAQVRPRGPQALACHTLATPLAFLRGRDGAAGRSSTGFLPVSLPLTPEARGAVQSQAAHVCGSMTGGGSTVPVKSGAGREHPEGPGSAAGRKHVTGTGGNTATSTPRPRGRSHGKSPKSTNRSQNGQDD